MAVTIYFSHLFYASVAFLIYRIFLWFKGPEIAGRPTKTWKGASSTRTYGKGQVIECTNPATGEVLGQEHAATPDDVAEAVSKARAAQAVWAKTSFAERRAVLSDIMDFIVSHQEQICKYSQLDTGKTRMEAYYGEVMTSCEKLRYIMCEGEKALAPQKRSPPLLLFLKSARVEYHPVGVVGIIIPWNYPFHNVLSAVSTAIFAGNAAVVKVSEWASNSRAYYESMFRNILIKRGHNPDLVTLLTGYGETGNALVKSGVDKILFIGSPATGRKVMAAASENLTPVTLELGGKDPFIVCDDAEIDQAVEAATRGVFINCGQNCIAAERLFIQEGVYDEFAQKVTKIAQNLRQGCSLQQPCDCGSMTMPGQLEIVKKLVDDAVQKGAKVLAGGKVSQANSAGTLFVEPTVLSDVPENADILSQETFGPVMLLIKWKTDDEVIQKANSTSFGLGSSIFSTNYARAEALAREVAAGMVTINDFGVGYLVQDLPFGGIKESGFGRFNGQEGLRDFCHMKSIVTDRFPIRTRTPRFTQYPVPDNGPEIVNSAITFIYGRGLGDRARGLLSLLKNMFMSS